MLLKFKYGLATFLFFFQCNVLIFCQAKQIITGVIIDKKTKESLPFSSLRLKNHPIGTISDEKGSFQFLIPSEITGDTLAVNHVGYEEFLISMVSIKEPLKIKLEPKIIEIDEAFISPLSPEELIKRALKKLNENYSASPFQTISYYKEKITENDNFIAGREGIFKSYYSNFQDTTKNQHQLLLYREPNEFHKLAFMSDFFEKQKKKSLKKAEKKGEEVEPEKQEEIDINLGGPEAILSSDLTKKTPSFLDTTELHEYKYTFGERTIYQGRELVTIHFKSRGKMQEDDMDGPVKLKNTGTVLLDSKTDAIVSVENTGKFVIPTVARPILLALGLKIKDPIYWQKIKYEHLEGKWYPKNFHWNGSVKLTKHHMLKPKEYSEIEIGQVFLISKITTKGIEPLNNDKLFDLDKKLKEQVCNDENITWDNINVLKN